MLVNTLSFMCSDPTAVITVWLLTDTTNAVPSTSTRESREPFPAARSTPSESLLRVEPSSSIPRRWTRSSACFENCSGWAPSLDSWPACWSASANDGSPGAGVREAGAPAGVLGAPAGAAAGWDQRWVGDRAHWTSVMLASLTPVTPSTVTVVPEESDWTLSTLPVPAPPVELE